MPACENIPLPIQLPADIYLCMRVFVGGLLMVLDTIFWTLVCQLLRLQVTGDLTKNLSLFTAFENFGFSAEALEWNPITISHFTGL